ncbi:protein CFAP276 [Rhodnius prolixus]|uniref:Protein panstrongylus lignarius n=1 Tax=Rhodnius prolixus TaxID=13249 RepID=A0A4V0Y8R9_RHOPR
MNNVKGKILPNPFPLPLIQYEELWEKPLMLPGYEYDWDKKVSVSERLYRHNTLASIRWHRYLKAPCAPKDSLDFMLSTVYDHGLDTFPEENFIYMQPDNFGLPTYKLLRNVRFVPEVRPARDLQEDDQPGAMDAESQLPGTKWHGIKIGGIGDRIDVNNVKLGLSSYHGPQSNAGFSRKIDGTYYGS